MSLSHSVYKADKSCNVCRQAYRLIHFTFCVVLFLKCAYYIHSSSSRLCLVFFHCIVFYVFIFCFVLFFWFCFSISTFILLLFGMNVSNLNWSTICPVAFRFIYCCCVVYYFTLFEVCLIFIGTYP